MGEWKELNLGRLIGIVHRRPDCQEDKFQLYSEDSGEPSMNIEQESDTASLGFRKQKSYLMYISSRLLSL